MLCCSSHDQHSDNLDRGGRHFLPKAAKVLTTEAGAKRLGGNARVSRRGRRLN
jgi:hypothetical protein